MAVVNDILNGDILVLRNKTKYFFNINILRLKEYKINQSI